MTALPNMGLTHVLLSVLVLQATHALAKEGCETAIVGAGIGGAYSAFRLASPSVCIFEANSRPGGRILTVRDPSASFLNFTIDLGAYRYHRAHHRLVRLIAEDVLNIPAACYTDLLNNRKDCPDATIRLFSTRGKVLGALGGRIAQDLIKKYGSFLPYVIQRSFRWGKGNPLKERRTMSGLLIGPNSVIKEIRDRVEELEKEEDYAKAMRIADEIIAAMQDGSYRGIPYSEISLMQVAIREGFTTEEMQLNTDFSFLSSMETRQTLEHNGQLSIRQMALEKGLIGLNNLVAPMEKRGGVLRRAGMITIVDGLLERAMKGGVQVQYGKKVVSITRTGNEKRPMRLKFEDGEMVEVRNVILNIGKPGLIALGLDSEPMKSAKEPFRRAVERNFVLGLSKTYCFWEDAWWLTKLGQRDGRIQVPSESMQSMRYHDGHVVCKDERRLKSCRGGLLASYSGGDQTGLGAALHAHVHNAKGYTPLTSSDNVVKLIPGRMSGVEQVYFDDLHAQIKRVHKRSVERMGLNVDKVISKPAMCLFADWREVGTHAFMGPGKGRTNMYELFAKPVSDLRIALVNEGWSGDQGWAEGSLRSAERALFHQFGMEKPEWMDEVYHRSVIERYNQG